MSNARTKRALVAEFDKADLRGERNDERTDNLHATLDIAGTGSDADSAADESDFDGFGFLLDGACGEADSDSPGPVSFLGGQAHRGGSHDFDLASDSPEVVDFSIPEGRGRSKERRQNRVTLDDFDDPYERYAAEQIIEAVKGLFRPIRNINEQSVAWLFGFAENSDGASLRLCCQALNAREFLIQTRVHYEFWVRWKVFPFEFPFETCPLPNLVRHEIRHIAGEEGIYIAQEAWIRPGIGTEEMLMNAAGVNTLAEIPEEYPALLAALEEKYILSSKAGSWYMTGRNPQRRLIEASGQGINLRADTVSWSRLY